MPDLTQDVQELKQRVDDLGKLYNQSVKAYKMLLAHNKRLLNAVVGILMDMQADDGRLFFSQLIEGEKE